MRVMWCGVDCVVRPFLFYFDSCFWGLLLPVWGCSCVLCFDDVVIDESQWAAQPGLPFSSSNHSAAPI